MTTEPFADLHGRLRVAVQSRAWQILHNDADAEDVAQLVWLKVAAALPTFRGDAKVDSWIYRITTNAALSYRRHARRKGADLSKNTALEDARAVLAREVDPLRRLLERERARRGVAALRTLCPMRRAAVLAFLAAGHVQPVADQLGLKLGTAKSRLYRGIAEVEAALCSSR